MPKPYKARDIVSRCSNNNGILVMTCRVTTIDETWGRVHPRAPHHRPADVSVHKCRISIDRVPAIVLSVHLHLQELHNIRSSQAETLPEAH